MKPNLYVIALALTMPAGAFAMPALGDVIGTDPETATTALKEAGCEVREFEVEDGLIEAKCVETETSTLWEIYIDPADGTVARIKSEDD